MFNESVQVLDQNLKFKTTSARNRYNFEFYDNFVIKQENKLAWAEKSIVKTEEQFSSILIYSSYKTQHKTITLFQYDPKYSQYFPQNVTS